MPKQMDLLSQLVEDHLPGRAHHAPSAQRTVELCQFHSEWVGFCQTWSVTVWEAWFNNIVVGGNDFVFQQ